MKVIMFRDSFSTNLFPYLGNTFGEILAFWRYPTKEDLEILKDTGDIVIIEVVERSIVSILDYLCKC
ncbi:MAG: hypothetical protein LBD19_00765 [Endomicrobium sp.]|jgi:hypothetical protein|nr:hypothetical protein [Endomicrobium sp.]